MKLVKFVCVAVVLMASGVVWAQALPPGLTADQKKAFEMMNDPAFQEKMREQQMKSMMSKEQFDEMQRKNGNPVPEQKSNVDAMKKFSADPASQEQLSKATPLACDKCEVMNELLMDNEKMMGNVPAQFQNMMPKVESKYPKIMFAKIFKAPDGKNFGVTAVYPGGGVERQGQAMAVNNPMMQSYYNKENLKNFPKTDDEYEKYVKEILSFGSKSSVQGFDAYVFESKEQQDKVLSSKGMSFLQPSAPGMQQVKDATSSVLILDKPDHVRIYLNYPEEKQGKRLLDYAAKMDLSVYESVFNKLAKK